MFLGLLLFAQSAAAITVSSPVLKWTEINTSGTVSHDYLVSSQNVTVEFSDNLESVCNSTTHKNNITITCSPTEGVYGNVRFSENLTGGETISTGVLLPISLSMNETPMVEPTEQTPTPTPSPPVTPSPPATAPPTTKATPKVTYTPLSLWVSLIGIGLVPLTRIIRRKK